uniref:Phage tail assembly chaperone protein, E, or 41 or 14 n=1 Tax=Candidatus Kentrum sp. FM TaxID=2126340 RepID=A0A450SSY9_9GAMM|nr:MAG: hypothetical protein BECKFM1743C_GA0114222_101903 [Candidatus Kentron sp. FM]VFJ57051.1 MAG: hypothetical protein BECKFM1743A_GA0114220_101814 [Candidatus Kentron sp. FM]VFK11508.1 MAG: hypothetical protein BECKFM1743B_GA0114221_101873 [Candidatus Kentron sp. FM]
MTATAADAHPVADRHEPRVDPHAGPMPPTGDVLKGIILPISGKTAQFFRRKGRNLANASRKAGGDIGLLDAAMISELITIDGNPVLMKELLDEYDFFDMLALQQGFGELGKFSQRPGS